MGRKLFTPIHNKFNRHASLNLLSKYTLTRIKCSKNFLQCSSKYSLYYVKQKRGSERNPPNDKWFFRTNQSSLKKPLKSNSEWNPTIYPSWTLFPSSSPLFPATPPFSPHIRPNDYCTRMQLTDCSFHIYFLHPITLQFPTSFHHHHHRINWTQFPPRQVHTSRLCLITHQTRRRRGVCQSADEVSLSFMNESIAIFIEWAFVSPFAHFKFFVCAVGEGRGSISLSLCLILAPSLRPIQTPYQPTFHNTMTPQCANAAKEIEIIIITIYWGINRTRYHNTSARTHSRSLTSLSSLSLTLDNHRAFSLEHAPHALWVRPISAQ